MQFHQLKLNKNNWVLSFFVRSVLISYPISPLRRRENKTRTFWSPEPILSHPRGDCNLFVCWDRCLEMFGKHLLLHSNFPNFCLQQNVQGHWNSSKASKLRRWPSETILNVTRFSRKLAIPALAILHGKRFYSNSHFKAANAGNISNCLEILSFVKKLLFWRIVFLSSNFFFDVKTISLQKSFPSMFIESFLDGGVICE